jgi:hypothetical protein
MLHLRVHCPPGLTDGVLRVPMTDTVSEIVALRGVGVLPAPDLIEAELVRESANDIVDAVLEFGVADLGAIQLVLWRPGCRDESPRRRFAHPAPARTRWCGPRRRTGPRPIRNFP